MAIDVDAILNRAIAIGTEKSTKANEAADAAMSAARGYSTMPLVKVPTAFTVVEPNVTIPTGAAGVDNALYNSTYDRIANDLGTKFAGFFTTYFPIADNLMTTVEAWLVTAMAGGSGINVTVENQIWQRDRDRVTGAALSAEAEATASWAAKGFPMPPGAAAAAIAQVRRDRDIKIFDASRDRAIKAWEMEYENVKFALQQAVDYRVKAVQAAGDYIKTIALAPQIASQLAVSAVNAQSALINAANGYYNSRIKVAELKMDIDKTNAQFQMQAAGKDVDSFTSSVHNQTQAAVSIATSLGSQAASALNSVNGTAQIITNQ